MDDLSAVIATEPGLQLEAPLVIGHQKKEVYRPAPGLKAAIDAALWLGQPLLLTGDPGVGKTRAAYWLAGALEAEPLLTFNVKSTSSGTDLLYSFDEVARFRDSSPGREVRPLVSYLRLNGLGEAIVRGAGGQAVLRTMSGVPLDTPTAIEEHRPSLDRAFGPEGKGWKVVDGAVRAHALLPRDVHFQTAAPAHRVLLIDELDKAPRDTPNDLLNEVEALAFRIPELDLMIENEGGRRPVIVVTSNSEKALPDPFLRRCVFFDIPFPEPDQLVEIIDGSIAALEGGPTLVIEAIDLFRRFRGSTSGVRRPPGTAELLAWLDLLVAKYGAEPHQSLMAREADVKGSLTAVLKSRDDVETGGRIVADWAAAKAKPAR
jgi:MoxR-like ATPase